MKVSEFFFGPKRYGDSEQPLNPIDRANQRWDRLIGHTNVQNYNLRKIIVGLLVVVIILAVGLIIQSTKSTVTPYVIEVDSTTGMARNVGAVKEGAYQPKEAELKYFLGEFVKNTREISLDPVIFKDRWKTAYYFLSKSAAAKMDALMQEENPAQWLGKKTVQVNILVVVPVGKDSYQVRWTEEEFLMGTGKKSSVPMTGIFTVTTAPVKDEATLQRNPLGIYLTDFNWSKESAAVK